MSKLKHIAYIVEFMIGFGPSLLVLTLGVIFSPVIILGIFSGEPMYLFYVLLVLFGLCGFWGAISLLVLTLHSEQENTKPKRLKIYICMGVISSSITSYMIGVSNIYLLPFVIAPLFVTLHLAYVQRNYLLAKVGDNSNQGC